MAAGSSSSPMKIKKLTLIFRGECSKCLILNRCVDWIAQQIKEAKGETVEITAVRKKPFFWDNN